MEEIITYLLTFLSLCLPWFIILYIRDKKFQAGAFLVFFIGYSFLHFLLHPIIYEYKFADLFAYTNLKEGTFYITFWINTMLIFPMYLVYDSSFFVYTINVFLFSVWFGLVIDNRSLTESSKKLLVTPIPLIYYSFFGLRDFTILLLIYATYYSYNSTKKSYLKANFIFICILFSIVRPEMLIIPLTLVFLKTWSVSGRIFRSVLIILFVGVLYLGPSIAGITLGIGSNISYSNIIDFAVLRYERHSGADGGGSHILGGSLFQLPFWQRYPVQVLSFFVNPLPFEFKLRYLPAAIDSILFSYLTLKSYSRYNSLKLNQKHILWASIIAILFLSLFTSNYGNLFRIRMVFYSTFIFTLTQHKNEEKSDSVTQVSC